MCVHRIPRFGITSTGTLRVWRVWRVWRDLRGI